MIDLHARSFERHGGIFRREPHGKDGTAFYIESISKLE